MGDAAGGRVVERLDLDDTIDAVEPRVVAPPQASALPPAEATAAPRDYPELIAVERNRYAIAGEIAKGGMGRVIEARDLRLGRQVAIKELLPQHRDAARRFEREARITARLQHPSIIHVYEAGVWPGGEPFYAMPKVAGRSLDKVVSERATLAERLGLIPTVIAVADALAYAHNERIIHRDLKPANVLVGDFGETVVIDWGLAKDLGVHSDPKESLELRLRAVVAEETLSGSVVGTPAYMPPEQARGESVDQRADVYALGALLYKVLVGAPPYDGASSSDVLDQVKAGPPVPVPMREPGAPPDLAAIVAKAMARDPADRYADAGELAQDLKLFETGQLVAAHHYTVRQLAWRWLRRHRWAIGTGSAAVVALAIVATLSVQRIVAERARAEAGRRALQEERGRIEILEGRSGMALAYLVGAAEDRVPGGARGFLIAEAMRAFEPERAHLAGGGRVVVDATADGRRVAIATTGIVTLWQGTARVRTLTTPGEIDALAFDPGGTHLIAGGHDGVARVWAVDDLAHVRELHGDAPIRALEVSPDGSRLVSGSDDGRVRIWDLASSTFIDAACHTEPVVAAHFAPAGMNRIVTASTDHTACVIDAANGTVKTLLRGHTDALTAAVWSADGAWVITASTDGTARVWAAEHGKLVLVPLRHAPGTAIRAIALSRDGQRVITAGDDGIARIWELPPVTPAEAEAAAAAGTPPSAKLIVALDGHAGPILSAQFAPDQRHIATGAKDGLARVWDAETGELVASFEHGETVDDLAFTASGTLVTGSSDGTARIWQVPERTRHDLFSPVHALAVASDGTIAAGTDDSRVRLWRDGSGAPLELDGQLGRVFALAFTPDGHHLVVAGDDRRPSVWDVRTHQRLLLGEHASAVHAVAVAPDASVAATVTDDDHVRLWSLSDGRLVRELSARGVVVNAIAFSPDGALLVAGLGDGSLARWRTGDGVLLGVQPAISGAVTALAFAPSGGALAVGGHSDARIYAVDGSEVGDLPAVTVDGPTGEVRAFAFACAGHCVITAGADGLARVWDAEKGKLLGTRGARGAPLGALAVAGDTLWLASEDTDGWIGGWNVRSDVRSLDELRAFFLDKHVPWALDRDDVVRRMPTRAR